MALKDWKQIPNWNMFVSLTFRNIKTNHTIEIKHQYYTENTAYWDVYLNSSIKIRSGFKTRKEALRFAKGYMSIH